MRWGRLVTPAARRVNRQKAFNDAFERGADDPYQGDIGQEKIMAAQIATVFGGSGFIGRYIVKRLAAAGYQVRIAGRNTEAAAALKPMGDVGQIVALSAAVNGPPCTSRLRCEPRDS